MELLGGSPVPAVEFGSRTLTNTSSSGADFMNSPQQSQTYASLSNSTSASTRMDMRVYAGVYRNTLIESITNIICRVELETIQFRGDENSEDTEYLKASRSQMSEEAAAAERELSQRERGAAADARLQRQRDRASAASGFTSQLEGVSSPHKRGLILDTSTSSSAATAPTTYTLWLREIESVDVLADRVVLISSSNATNTSPSSDSQYQLAGGRNVTIYCNSDVTLAAAVGRVIKSRVDTAMQLHRLQQRRLLERDEELEEAGEALDGLATHRGGGSSSPHHHHRQGRYDPSISLRGDMVIRGSGGTDVQSLTANTNDSSSLSGNMRRVVAVPTTSHSTSSLPLRNYTRAANSFNSLAAALKESNNASDALHGDFDRNLKMKLAAAHQMDDTRPTSYQPSTSTSKPQTSGNVAGDFVSDDVLNPRRQHFTSSGDPSTPQTSGSAGSGRMVLDATASSHQKDYIRSSMVGISSGLSRGGAMTNATVMAAPYSHYPALRSPFQTHPSPSQPYRAVAAEKSAAQQHHVNLLNDKREAERRESAARTQVEDLTKELRSMRSEISVLKTAHNARFGARSGGLSEMLRGFGISDGGADMDSSSGLLSPKTPTRGASNFSGGGGGGGASRLNFDAILEPSIDVRVLQHSASDTPEQTAAKKAAAELLLRADGGGGISTSAAIQRVLSQGGVVPTSGFNGRSVDSSSPQHSLQYNQTLARSLAAGAKKRGSVMLEQLMIPNSNGGGGMMEDSGLMSPNDPNMLGTPFDSARRTISHRAEARHRVRVQSPSDQHPVSGGGDTNSTGADSVSVTPKDSSSRLQRRSSSSGLLTRTASSGKPSPSTTDLVRKDSRNNSQFLPTTTGAFSVEEDPLASTQKPTVAPMAATPTSPVAPTLAVTPPSVAPPAKKGVPPPPPKKSAPAAPAVVVESSPATPAAPSNIGPPPPKGVPPPPSKKAPPPPSVTPAAPQPTASPPVSTSGGPSAPKGVPPPPPKKAPPAPKQPPPEPPAAQQAAPKPAAAAPVSTNGGPAPPRGVPPPPPKKAAPKPPTEPI